MVATFAFFAGLYYDLPIGYFLLGFTLLFIEWLVIDANR